MMFKMKLDGRILGRTLVLEIKVRPETEKTSDAVEPNVDSIHNDESIGSFNQAHIMLAQKDDVANDVAEDEESKEDLPHQDDVKDDS